MVAILLRKAPDDIHMTLRVRQPDIRPLARHLEPSWTMRAYPDLRGLATVRQRCCRFAGVTMGLERFASRGSLYHAQELDEPLETTGTGYAVQPDIRR